MKREKKKEATSSQISSQEIGPAKKEEQVEEEEEEEETSGFSDVSRSFVDGRVEDVMSWPPPKMETSVEEVQEGMIQSHGCQWSSRDLSLTNHERAIVLRRLI